MSNPDIIDKEKLLFEYDGIFDILQEGIQLFLNDYVEMTKSIESAIAEKDPEKLKRSAHTLKGTLKNFYAYASASKALELEDLGNSGNLSNAQTILKDLKIELEKLIPELKGIE